VIANSFGAFTVPVLTGASLETARIREMRR
jgi:hypothetical protein